MNAPTGYLASPTDLPRGGVMVLHAWWGLNADVRAYCDRLAAEGFVAFAPDLLNGGIADTVDGAKELMKANRDREDDNWTIIADAAAYVSGLVGGAKIGVVGFSYGAYFALEYSNRDSETIGAVVVYYGAGPEDFGSSSASYLGHFAETDDYEPAESVAALGTVLEAAGRPTQIHVYPGTTHWFAEPGVDSAHDELAAELAWGRTVEFLVRELAG